MTIYFYTPNQAYGEFSNFSKHGVEFDGKWWSTVEHYFQAQKFYDEPYRERIRRAQSAKMAANLGRTRAVPIREDWEQVKDEVMLRAVRNKFNCHRALAERLLGTGSEALVENAPGDYYWGCGADGSGLNRLGLILQQVRSELAKR